MTHLITQYLPQVNPCRQTLPKLPLYIHDPPHYTIPTSRQSLYTDTTYTPIIHTCPTSLHNIYLKSTPVDKHYLNTHYTHMTHLITQYLPQVNPCRQTLPKLPLYIHDPPHYTIPTSRQSLYTDTTYTPIIHTWPTSLHNTYPKSTPVDKHYLNTIIHTWPTSLHNTYLKSTPVDKHYLNTHYTHMTHLITQYLPQVNPCRQTLPKLPLYIHDPPHYTIPTSRQPLYTDTTYTPIIHTWPTSLHNTYPKSTPVDKHYLNTIIHTWPTSLHNTYLKSTPVDKHYLNSHYTFVLPHYTIPTPSQPL